MCSSSRENDSGIVIDRAHSFGVRTWMRSQFRSKLVASSQHWIERSLGSDEHIVLRPSTSIFRMSGRRPAESQKVSSAIAGTRNCFVPLPW